MKSNLRWKELNKVLLKGKRCWVWITTDLQLLPDLVLIRYGKFPNSTLLLDFGFTLPYNAHDQLLGCTNYSNAVHFALRRQMAWDLLSGELRVLNYASAWLSNYCNALSMGNYHPTEAALTSLAIQQYSDIR
ncbi:hypothetical protein Syun_001238 [Stephania yunnanensis]|uniref:Uncharacterized protein n=1 Tax=Stephania yunnanensis TaxID=152371 RepID=A0AAP0LEG6_9MAGN